MGEVFEMRDAVKTDQFVNGTDDEGRVYMTGQATVRNFNGLHVTLVAGAEAELLAAWLKFNALEGEEREIDMGKTLRVRIYPESVFESDES